MFHEKARLLEIVVRSDRQSRLQRFGAAQGSRTIDGRNASGGDDGGRHSADDGPAQPGCRRRSLHGHHRLRWIDALGPVEKRCRRQIVPGSGRKLVGLGDGQEGLDFQASPWRSLSRRIGVQCRCGRLELRQACEPERCRNSMRDRRRRAACTPVGSRPGASSTTTRSKSPRRSQTPSCLTPWRASSCRVPPSTRNWGGTGASSPSARRDGAVETQLVQAARARRPRAQSRPLGQGADSKCERLVLLPIPDANTRVAALLSATSIGSRLHPLMQFSVCGSRRCRSSRTSIHTCGRTC